MTCENELKWNQIHYGLLLFFFLSQQFIQLQLNTFSQILSQTWAGGVV